MKEYPNSKPPITPLNEADEEQISGGTNILGVYDDDLSNLENELKRRNALKYFETYDKSQKSDAEKARFFAKSWNRHHPGQNMSEDLAHQLLSLEDKNKRADLAYLSSADDIQAQLNV